MIKDKIGRSAGTYLVGVSPIKQVFDSHFESLADNAVVGSLKNILFHFFTLSFCVFAVGISHRHVYITICI